MLLKAERDNNVHQHAAVKGTNTLPQFGGTRLLLIAALINLCLCLVSGCFSGYLAKPNDVNHLSATAIKNEADERLCLLAAAAAADQLHGEVSHHTLLSEERTPRTGLRRPVR